MNKMLVISLLATFLVGCTSNIEPEPIPVHPLFSADENKYSLLIVGETKITEYHTWQEENEINNVRTIHGRSSLEETNGQYKFLELERSPAYVVFDTKDIVFKTYSEEELIEFLTTNNPK